MKAAPTDIAHWLREQEGKELLRFITCGSVDDGKSTHSHRDIHFKDAKLRTVGTDHADRTNANLTVDPHTLRCVLNTESPRRGKTKTRTR